LVERTQPPPIQSNPSQPETRSQQTTANDDAQQSANANHTEETNIFIGGFPMNGNPNAPGGMQTFIQQFLNGLTDFGVQNGANVNFSAGTANSAPGGANQVLICYSLVCVGFF
jgi:hypothetical protein